MAIVVDGEYSISVGEEEVVAVDFTDYLARADGTDGTLTGTPTESSGANVTVGSIAVNTETIYDEDRNRTIEIGKALVLSVTVATEATHPITVDTVATSFTNRAPIRTINIIGT